MVVTGNISVAIVEDTEDIRVSLATLIGGNDGFECGYSLSSAEQALRDLPGKKVDIVLMDISMPGMSGIECVRKLKPLMPGTHFMMCTVYNDDESIFNALKAGASGYILKRTTPEKIIEALKELFNGGSPMSSEIARRVVSTFNSGQKVSNQNIESLTAREKEILELLAKGFLYKEIADSLFISRETVKKHIHNIYRKLEVQTRTEALNKAYSR